MVPCSRREGDALRAARNKGAHRRNLRSLTPAHDDDQGTAGAHGHEKLA